MAYLLDVGKEFKSFEALQDAVHKYEQTCFAQLSRTDSRTIENEESRRTSKLFNPDIKYSFVTFTCAFGGKPYVSRSTGIRNSKPRIKCDCPVILKCFASSDGQKLVVRHSSLDCHNHDTSEESFKALPRGRLLDEETEQEIFILIESHENKKLARKLVKEKLIQETGRDITYKDIQNIEKRMSKKKNQGERNGRTEDEDSDASNQSDLERDEREVDDKGENASESQTDKAEVNDDDNASDTKGKVTKAPSTPKKGIKASATTARSSTRPKRAIREPTRFRDPSLKLSSSVLKRRASESENSWEEDSDSAHDTIVFKKEPQTGRRGRPKGSTKKPKMSTQGSSDEGSDIDPQQQSPVKKEKESLPDDAKKSNTVAGSNSNGNSNSLASRQLDLEEKRLKIQEEMLALQRQSMLLLQNMVTKLDRVEANQTMTDKGDALTASPSPTVTVTADSSQSDLKEAVSEVQQQKSADSASQSEENAGVETTEPEEEKLTTVTAE